MSFRVVMFLGFTALFAANFVVPIIVGSLLIISGVASLYEDDDEEVENLLVVRFFKWAFGGRLYDNYCEEPNLFTRDASGRLQVTVFFLVVCVIAVVDCILAADSVGSKIGTIQNLYINMTSSLMAMLSLRAFYFLIKDLADYFEYVKYGVCLILWFVGVKMIVEHWYHFTLLTTFLVIAVLFVGSLLISVVKVKYEKEQEEKDEQESEKSDVGPSNEKQTEDKLTSEGEPEKLPSIKSVPRAQTS